MVELTPSFLGNSLVIVMVGYGIALVFQLYMMYLNWKQSKVKENTTEIIKELKEIKIILKEDKNETDKSGKTRSSINKNKENIQERGNDDNGERISN